MADGDVYYFVADETNVNKTETNRFFIYGGLALSGQQLLELTTEIAAIRTRHGFSPTDTLKFATNSRPTSMSLAVHTQAKNDVIEACERSGARFIVQLIHHDIADRDSTTDYALNTVLSVFHRRFLEEHKAHGVVIIDRLPSGQAYGILKNKFQVGLSFDDGRHAKLDRILLYATTCDGASHISSAVDIILGAFRWVVNCQSKPVQGATERKLLTMVARTMFAHEVNGRRHLREYGLVVRPKSIKSPKYQWDYEVIIKYLQSLLK